MVKKLKKKAREVEPEPEVVVAPAGTEGKIKKKKKRKIVDAPLVAAAVEEPPRKKLKKKRVAEAAPQAQEPEAAEAVPVAKKLKKKKKKVREAVEETTTETKKEKKAKTSKTSFFAGDTEKSELSEEDSFFAGDNDKKHEDKPEKKVPDHMNPLKVFVGGLPWAVTEETVRADFAECGEIERFDMPLNQEGKPSGNAFIYYKEEEGVVKALEFDGTDYQGRSIKVKRAVSQKAQNQEGGKGKDGKGKDGKGKDGKDGKSSQRNNETTAFVGGLSFDTDFETLKKDFEECGEVIAVRMCKGDDGSFKGIAFVQYKEQSGLEAALKYNGDEYGGRTLKVTKAGETGGKGKDKGKGKDGKGKDGKGKGKDGKGKGKDGKGKGKGKGVCYKFAEGNCTRGDSCIFSHEA